MSFDGLEEREGEDVGERREEGVWGPLKGDPQCRLFILRNVLSILK